MPEASTSEAPHKAWLLSQTGSPSVRFLGRDPTRFGFQSEHVPGKIAGRD
jgi:hypothetical protein